MLGKINALDLLASDPVLGGLGTQRFMNFVFVAPPSGVTPPTIMGGILSHKSAPVSLTLMVYDPEDRTQDYWPEDLFDTGVNVSLGGKWSGPIAGRASSINLAATYSTKRGADLEDILVPPGLVTDDRKGSYNIAVQVNRRLVDSRQVEGKGLDFVLKAAAADGNPNVVQNQLVVGVAGHGMVPRRPNDSFGIGGFAFDVSDALQDGLDEFVDFDNELGIEAWYSLAVTSWFSLAADVQYVNPALGNNDPALIMALRANLSL
jgi:porin